MMNSLISVSSLSRRFGAETVLDQIDLEIPAGRVFGLVGENGAGKTTLIRHCLGLYRAQSGSVRVFGQDPVADPASVLSRIGFLSEDRDLPDWMTVGELMRFQAPFYSGWDQNLVEELRVNFGLPEKRPVSQLSRGQKAKLGLLVALGHRPELLLLDEPSSGLDPLARRDILEVLIRTTISEGRTVFFSSHLLDEIERVCDWVGFLIRGRIVLQGSVAEINERHRRLIARFDRVQNTLPDIPGSTTIAGRGMEWTLVGQTSVGEITRSLKEMGGKIVDDQVASLEEVFLAYSRSDFSQQSEKERG